MSGDVQYWIHRAQVWAMVADPVRGGSQAWEVLTTQFPKKKQETKWISALFGYTTPRIACSNPKRRRQWRGEEEKLGQEAVGVIGEKREGGVGDAAGVGGGGVAMDLAPGVVRRRCGVMAATDNDDAAS
jgi:hypothetical protein